MHHGWRAPILALAIGACARASSTGAGGSAPPSAVHATTPEQAAETAAAAAVSGPVLPQEAGAPGRATDDDDEAHQRVALFLARVAAVRELAAKTAVQSRVRDRVTLIKEVREHVSRELPPEVLRGQGEILIGLGWLPPDYNYEEGAFRLLQAQLAGFYNPRDKRMYLAADLDERAADVTLAHELVHALQDQHYDLGSGLSYQPGASDRLSAVQALAEGDATSAMLDLMLVGAKRRGIDVSDDVFAAGIEQSMTSGEAAASPRVLRRSLASPYTDGLRFVHQLRKREVARTKGGSGWAAVDAAWRSPPQTTEQVLHLDKYDAHEPAESLPDLPPPAPEGWTVAYDDVFGEQGLRIGLEEWLSNGAAKSAAQGWGGDRAVLFRRDDAATFASAWRIRYDSAPGRDPTALAKRAYDHVVKALGSGRIKGSSVCRDRDGVGPLLVLRSGRELAVVAGPYRREGQRVTAAGSCGGSLAWATAVLSSQPR